MRSPFLESELRQIRQTRTLDRAKYYVRRLERALTTKRTLPINDLNLNRWKEYGEIITDSLWILDKRDRGGNHRAWYWGNFVPQIPRQLLLRYTKRGEWVLDPFAGSGTTLLECQVLGRNAVGIELRAPIARRVNTLLKKNASGTMHVNTSVLAGDSSAEHFDSIIRKGPVQTFDFALLHPPYHDIIRFSSKQQDLSNSRSTEEFISRFGRVIDNVLGVLAKKRYFAVVIGDKYTSGEWIPLGFFAMQETLKRACTLKSVIVKNFDETTAKRTQKELWRYRALAGGFYVFKHEYIFLFQKK